MAIGRIAEAPRDDVSQGSYEDGYAITGEGSGQVEGRGCAAQTSAVPTFRSSAADVASSAVEGVRKVANDCCTDGATSEQAEEVSLKDGESNTINLLSHMAGDCASAEKRKLLNQGLLDANAEQDIIGSF